MFRILILTLIFLLLPACTAPGTGTETEDTTPAEKQTEDAIPALPEEDLVTRNVTYTGMVEEGGVTIYQQGTHRLMLSDGKMVLIESDDGANLGLDLYVGKLVRVKGDVMPTVEAGGTLMKARDIAWIKREVNPETNKQEEVLRQLCGAGVTCVEGLACVVGDDGVGVCGEAMEDKEDVAEVKEIEKDMKAEVTNEEVTNEEVTNEEVTNEEVTNEEVKKVEPSQKEQEAVIEKPSIEVSASASASAAIDLMIEEDYTADRWTQEYCTAHIGFCVPVHMNWYFKSFGATASLLWHVEMGASTVDALGDGPISVDLKSGTLEGLGVTDEAVAIVGGRVIGYRSWSDNRHFEISAVSSLKTPVSHVTKNLKVSATQSQ